MKTKEDVKKSLSDYSVLLINKFVIIGLLLISTPLLTRILGKTGYGQLNLFNLVVNIAFICFVSWTSTSILRFGKEEYIKENKLNEVFWARNIIVFGGLLVSIFFIFFLREKIDRYKKGKYSPLLLSLLWCFRRCLFGRHQ